VDQAQTAKCLFSQGVIPEIRNYNPLFIADDDIFDNALAIDENGDLATDIIGKFNEAGSQFLSTELRRRYTPPVESLQSLELA